MATNNDMSAQVLGLHSEPMKDFRENLDEALRMLVTNMTERDLGTGTITAKIKVTIEHSDYGFTQMKIEPDISIKIGAKAQKKCGIQQGIFLKYDQDGMPVVAGNQISLDDYIRNRDGREVGA